jgi:hypothetical protein
MGGTAYKLLGYAVWRGGRWYLRKRLPSRRRLGVPGLAVGAGLAAAVVAIARRASG